MKNSIPWDREPRKCINCSKIYTPVTRWQKLCAYRCSYNYRNKKNNSWRINSANCGRCGKSLVGLRSNAIYCSRTCKSLDHNFKNKRKTRATTTARRREIWVRDQGCCYICQKPVGPKEFELDHLIPVSRGGNSNPENLAVSCRFCNRSRGNRIEVTQLYKLAELRN